MIDDLLLYPVLMAPEIGAAANDAFKSWVGGMAREMVKQAVQEAVKQTHNALPAFVRSSVASISTDLTNSIMKQATSTAEAMLSQHLAGYTIVNSGLYEAQLAVVQAARSGGDIEGALARLDARAFSGSNSV